MQRRNRLVPAVVGVAALLALAACGDVEPSEPEAKPEIDWAGTNEPRGLRIHEPEAQPGYTLFGALLSDTVYLIDNDGQVVHTWQTDYAPGVSVYLLDNGNLLRASREPEVERFSGGGQGGRIQEISWDGEVLWDFAFASDQYLQHHDIEILPNGNVLAIAWEHKTAEEARRVGRHPGKIPEAGVWPDMVVEIEPQRPDGGNIVWKWHAWDHLVQNHRERLPGYGEPSELLGRIDVNYGVDEEITPAELEKLRSLGYISADTTAEDIKSDFFHTNAIDYNAELDQIALSPRTFHEIWILDHSTTTEEAAGNSGGRWGRGGEILYRWGNPAAYGRGDEADQRLFSAHDVRWIPEGYPGAGNLTIFSNDMEDDGGHYSMVYEIQPPIGEDEHYALPTEGEPFGPEQPVWSYRGTADALFWSPFVSGAHRLPNGNTLICSGAQGRFFEVTPEGRIVWEFWDPRQGTVRMPDGSTPHPVDEFTHAVFRASRIPPDHPGLQGRELLPLDPQPPIEAASSEDPS